jgi:hypothetical protein
VDLKGLPKAAADGYPKNVTVMTGLSPRCQVLLEYFQPQADAVTARSPVPIPE